MKRKPRFPLFQERAHALLPLLGRPHRRDPSRRVVHPRRVQRRRRHVADQSLRLVHRIRRIGEQHVDEALHGRVQRRRVAHLVHVSQSKRFLRIEALRGQHVAPRRALAHRADHVRADGGGDQPEPRLRETEARVARRDRDVACGDEPRAARVRVALHARDHRLRAIVDGLQHQRELPRVGDVLVVGVARHALHPVQVGAGAERLARGREHHDLHRRVVRDGVEHARELADHRVGERVAHVGPVERDRRDAIGDDDLDRFVRRHIRNTPKRVSSTGAFSAAENDRPSTRRVCAGSTTPSSQRRADA